MKALTVVFLISSVFILTGCADEFRFNDLLADGNARCSQVSAADTPWLAGCATRHNLAMLAEDPDDLILPHPEAPRAPMGRDTLFDSHGRTPRPGLQSSRIQTAAEPASQTVAGGTE